MPGRAGMTAAAWAAALLAAEAGRAEPPPVNAGVRAERAEILPMRQRAELEDRWLERRLDTLIPALMREFGVEMWILVAREYNEDPVVETMLPATWLSARRRTILVFADDGDTVRRLAVSRYPVGAMFEAAWDPEAEPDQWARLAALVAEHDPGTIALNVSSVFAQADGLSHQQREELLAALPDLYRARIVSGEDLALSWLETRSSGEMERSDEREGDDETEGGEPTGSLTTYVAFNDVNDLLGFELPPYLADVSLTGPLINVSVRNPAFRLGPLLKAPTATHTSQADNPAIIHAIVEGFDIPDRRPE
ncbi:MAG: hypothetical protein MI723_10035 [Caulobacterales bacterium]|nr:hypothetical protein [Caulobacterales bacterium]